MVAFNQIREENKQLYEQERALRIELRSNLLFFKHLYY